MAPALVAFLEVIVPWLVSEAEKLISRGNENSGIQKHQWVTDAVHAVMEALDPHFPDWAKADEAQLQQLLDDAIERAVAKL